MAKKLKSTSLDEVAVERKATTFRLDPSVQAGLVLLGAVLKKPLNRLVNEAVQGFVGKRSIEVQNDLQETLDRLKAYRASDPKFERAIAEFIEAEASLGGEDPVEGQGSPSVTGPAQTLVRELLRG